jgi:multiple sugar transport system permease protein
MVRSTVRGGVETPPLGRAVRKLTDRIDQNLSFFFPLTAVVVVLGLAIYPIIYTLVISARSYDLGLAAYSFVGFSNYANALTSTQFWSALPAYDRLHDAIRHGLGHARNGHGRGAEPRLPRRTLARTAFLLPMVATPVATSLVWMMMFNPTLGILNYVLQLIGLPPSLWVADPKLVIPCIVLVDVWHSAPSR